MSLEVKIDKKKDSAYVIYLDGSLDSETYTDCEKQIAQVLQEKPRAFIFDLNNLSYISSAGLSVVFRTKKEIEKNNASFSIVNVQPNIKKVFDAVKVISEDLFATMDGTDEQLDRYIDHVIKKLKPENTQDNPPPQE